MQKLHRLLYLPRMFYVWKIPCFVIPNRISDEKQQ